MIQAIVAAICVSVFAIAAASLTYIERRRRRQQALYFSSRPARAWSAIWAQDFGVGDEPATRAAWFEVASILELPAEVLRASDRLVELKPLLRRVSPLKTTIDELEFHVAGAITPDAPETDVETIANVVTLLAANRRARGPA